MREEIKAAIEAQLTGTAGLKAVYTHRPKIQNAFPSVVIHLPKADETRVSATAPIGKKRIDFTAQLEIFTVDMTPDGSGQADFDVLLDAIDDKLRSDVTLGGAVLASGIQYIKTVVAPPQLVNGQNIALLAVKTFDVSVYVTG